MTTHYLALGEMRHAIVDYIEQAAAPTMDDVATARLGRIVLSVCERKMTQGILKAAPARGHPSWNGKRATRPMYLQLREILREAPGAPLHFQVGNLLGRRVVPSDTVYARGLSHDEFRAAPEAREWADGVARGAIVYVVLSYGTPIAWRMANGWWQMPYVEYSSPTTTRHTRAVWLALSNPTRPTTKEGTTHVR